MEACRKIVQLSPTRNNQNCFPKELETFKVKILIFIFYHSSIVMVLVVDKKNGRVGSYDNNSLW